ncbi:VWA domain-containing protein, partial [Halorubrum sp. CBA1125]|uniref:VWA domain-containing protein n=1 Tax=Halorubrum sp. CBA1125 TaxID=2668072 RepID=UPI0012E7D62F
EPLDDAPDGALAPLGPEGAPPGEATETAETETNPGDEWEDGDLPLVRSAIEPGPPDGRETDGTTATYSPAGRPETVTVDMHALVDDEPLDAAVDRLVGSLASLRGRRWQRAGDGGRADPRRALRQSVATGGAVVSLPERSRRETAVRVVVLADVSRSVLDVVDRGFLLRFLRTLTARVRRSRVFFFDSDVRDVTVAFDEPTTADAVGALERAETSWGGGTRIGHAVETVRREHSEAIDRRTVALVVSDGLEMGDVADLERGMTWLAGRARAVLWLNPLAANPEYEPTPAGMAAALPSVDGLFAFIDSEDILEMARQLEQYGAGGRIGLEYDPRRRREATRRDTKTEP